MKRTHNRHSYMYMYMYMYIVYKHDIVYNY